MSDGETLRDHRIPLPQIPILVPVIVAGLTVGSVIKSKSGMISNRKLFLASLAAGLLNAIYAYAVYSSSPQPTFFRGTSSVSSTSMISYVLASVLAGFLVVFGVLGIAVLCARIRKGEELEVLPESTTEQEPRLTQA